MCEAHKEFSHLHGYMALSFSWPVMNDLAECGLLGS